MIDDDSDLRMLIHEIGQISGLRLLEAENCCSGLKVLEKESSRIKFIFMGYFMPGMTPSDYANSLKEKVKNSQIPIIFLTAAVAPEERAAELILSRWLAKPFDMNYLLKILKSNEA